LSAEYAIPASTGSASADEASKALSILSTYPLGTTPDEQSLAIKCVTSLIFALPSVQAITSQCSYDRLVQCAQTDGKIVRWRSALRKVSVGGKSYLHWESPVCLWRWQVARQHQPAKRRRTSRRSHRVTKSFLVRRKSSTSAWRRSMSSTRKIPDHPRSPKS
jgi:hypothetical protein